MALGRVPYRNSGSGLYIIIARDLASEPVQQQQQPLDNLWVARVRVGALMCQ